jgi:hypothetical protein
MASQTLYSEQQGSLGANTFTNPYNASGMGVKIAPYAYVQVSCKVYAPQIISANPDGYWYRIHSAPWNDAYYAVANTFWNGDIPGQKPYVHNTDFAVPDCGSQSAPGPAATATLAQGPAAPSGYRYAVTVDHFTPNSSVSVSCRDSVSPGGFYTFSLSTDASGHGFTQSYCYSGDGPDHWVVINGSIESNHVSWVDGSNGGASPGGGSAGGGGSKGGGKAGGGGGTGGGACLQYRGSRIADSGSVAASLLGHYLGGIGDQVVIDWSYFSRNSSFVSEAKSLRIGQVVSGWAPSSGTDMYNALGHFTIARDTADCYLVYDHYDFYWDSAKEYLVFFPLWAIQIFGAREFDIHASGRL